MLAVPVEDPECGGGGVRRGQGRLGRVSHQSRNILTMTIYTITGLGGRMSIISKFRVPTKQHSEDEKIFLTTRFFTNGTVTTTEVD